MTTRTNVTERDAQKVVAAILRQTNHDDPELFAGVSPPIVRESEYGDDWDIIWEEGPFQWPYLFPFGGIEEEFGFRLKDVSSDLPDHVMVEAKNHYSITLYPHQR